MVRFKPYVGVPMFLNPDAVISVREVSRRDNDGIDYKHTQVELCNGSKYEFRDTVEEVVKAIQTKGNYYA